MFSITLVVQTNPRLQQQEESNIRRRKDSHGLADLKQSASQVGTGHAYDALGHFARDLPVSVFRDDSSSNISGVQLRHLDKSQNVLEENATKSNTNVGLYKLKSNSSYIVKVNKLKEDKGQ